VEINGKTVAANVSVAVPIDPGKVSVSARGRDDDRVVTETWTHDYTAVEGETLAIEIPALASRPKVVDKPVAPKPEAATVHPELASRRHRRHVIALVLGGVALGAGVGGTVFGLDARAKYADARRDCNGTIDQCPPDQIAASQQHVDDARTSATRSSILFGVAGAAVVGAVVVWITAPSLETKGVAVAPSVGRGSVGLVLGGAF
jgi:hypothetical protein